MVVGKDGFRHAGEASGLRNVVGRGIKSWHGDTLLASLSGYLPLRLFYIMAAFGARRAGGWGASGEAHWLPAAVVGALVFFDSMRWVLHNLLHNLDF